MGIVETLREASAESHERAEHHPFVQRIFSSELTKDEYGRYLASLLPLYEKLDRVFRESPFTQLRVLDSMGLERAEAIRSDMAALEAEPLPGESEYALRIQYLNKEFPLGLLAHVYARYLGDLAGGQMIAKKLEASLGLSRQRGLRLYEFPKVSSARQAAAKIRSALNSVDCSESELDRLAREAKRSFALSIGVFDYALG